ncbi:MAG: hypothetical protein HQ512_10075 [Rhodospirillales bacterium]|nr:hypothetical protein [Rhodospirillales bacterium]
MKNIFPFTNGHFVARLFAGLFVVLAITGFQAASARQANAKTTQVAAANENKEVKKFIDLGMKEAKQKNWRAAIEHFKKAVYAASYKPPARLLFNAGFANDKLGGREFAAIGYYRAYLAKVPDARNAKAIMKRIGELEVKIAGNARKLLKLMESFAAEFPPDSYAGRNGYYAVAIARAEVGDVEQAIALVPKLSSIAAAYSIIAHTQAKSGDFSGAKQTCRKIKKRYNITLLGAYGNIAIEQAKVGDTKGVLETAKQIATIAEPGKNNRKYALEAQTDAYIEIASTLIQGNDVEWDFKAAKPFLTLAKETADKFDSSVNKKYSAYAHLSGLWMKIGNVKKAWEVAALAKPNKEDLDFAYGNIAQVYASAGEIEEAEKALDMISRGSHRREGPISTIKSYRKAKKDLETSSNRKERENAQVWLRVFKPIGKRTFSRAEALDWTYSAVSNYRINEDFRKYIHALEGKESDSPVSNRDGIVTELGGAIANIMRSLRQFQKKAAFWKNRLRKN